MPTKEWVTTRNMVVDPEVMTGDHPMIFTMTMTSMMDPALVVQDQVADPLDVGAGVVDPLNGDVVDAVGVADSAEDPLLTSCAGAQGVDLDLHLE